MQTWYKHNNAYKMKLKKLHYFSGITLSIFIGVHLLNHLAALFGAATHIKVMNLFRVIYRHPAIETLLLIAVAIQIISGLIVVFKQRGKKTSAYDKIQVYSGLYLALFLIAHTIATVWRGRQVLGLDTNFYFAAIVVQVVPAVFFFIPYYFLGVVSVFGHIAAVHYKKMRPISLDKAKKQARYILIAGVAIALLILISLSKPYQNVKIPKEYHQTLKY